MSPNCEINKNKIELFVIVFVQEQKIKFNIILS